MHAILKDLFYQVYFSLFILGLVAVVLIDHGEVVLWVNQHRNSVLDGVMPRWTHLGDGFMVVGAILVSLFVNRRIGILLIGIGLAQAALTALLKRVIFRGTPRPKSFFDEGVLDFIQGVKVHSWHSFPSGHTMTAFSIAAF
ncbi:MAG: phosphatase PAP2 family protein, partial [Cyclobacteriaceae bacterium]|nr:phosphatase PAP2 family protein [Cyclobacteriaceae bacterium HetDA_MAG_MS6]